MLAFSSEVRRYEEGHPPYFVIEDAPRLVAPTMVETLLSAERNRFTLIKPLCESQRANELLERFPGAHIMWIFRHYDPCIASHIRFYRAQHDPMEYVREVVDPAARSWKSVGLSMAVRVRLAVYQHAELTPESAYAIFWLARNLLYFNVVKSARVHLINYETLVEAPQRQSQPIFAALGLPYRPQYGTFMMKASEHARKIHHLDAALRSWCDDTYERLLAETRSSSFAAAHLSDTRIASRLA
jgi:hypothetical protein